MVLLTVFRKTRQVERAEVDRAVGLTQAELAERAEMTQPQLSRLESGGSTPTVPLLARLAAALNADLDITFRPHTPVAA